MKVRQYAKHVEVSDTTAYRWYKAGDNQHGSTHGRRKRTRRVEKIKAYMEHAMKEKDEEECGENTGIYN